ncbi:MAG: hypothetical protein HY236_00635 [Acidobacteria bacterium]|nr:hypothetical protein [Acidobacteriota bacterium]
MLNFAQDLRYGWRQLRRNKGFTIVAVLTLALGIGSLVTIFSVVKGVLLEPLPFERADRLVMVRQSAPQYGLDRYSLTEFNFAFYRDNNTAFEQMAAYDPGTVAVTGRGEAERRGQLQLLRPAQRAPRFGTVVSARRGPAGEVSRGRLELRCGANRGLSQRAL